MPNHPCWSTAMHEASHIAVFLKLGGKWGAGKDIYINPGCGRVTLGGLWDQEYGFLLDYCVFAAGVAADRIQGVSSYIAPGSDMYALMDLAIDYRYSAKDIEIVITKVETWLKKHNWAIETTATELIASRLQDGKIPLTKSKKIVEQLMNLLPSCRKLMRRRRR